MVAKVQKRVHLTWSVFTDKFFKRFRVSHSCRCLTYYSHYSSPHRQSPRKLQPLSGETSLAIKLCWGMLPISY